MGHLVKESWWDNHGMPGACKSKNKSASSPSTALSFVCNVVGCFESTSMQPGPLGGRSTVDKELNEQRAAVLSAAVNVASGCWRGDVSLPTAVCVTQGPCSE